MSQYILAHSEKETSITNCEYRGVGGNWSTTYSSHPKPPPLPQFLSETESVTFVHAHKVDSHHS
jgi:hypothetical protein